MSEQQLTWFVIAIGIGVAIAIYLVTRSLGMPVQLPKEKPPKVRRPRPQRAPRRAGPAPDSGHQPTQRQLAPDDDIDFLRSLDTKRRPTDEP
ncbi:MAG: hypothetical protein ACRCYQ_09610 [Nocardioides sp.]